MVVGHFVMPVFRDRFGVLFVSYLMLVTSLVSADPQYLFTETWTTLFNLKAMY